MSGGEETQGMEKSETVEAETVIRPYQRASVIRIILAFLMCPALPIVFAMGFESIGLFWLAGGYTPGLLLMIGVVSYLVAVVVGVPLYLLLVRRGKLGLGEFVLWGCTVALVLSAPVIIVMPITLPWAFILSILLWFALVRIPPKTVCGFKV